MKAIPNLKKRSLNNRSGCWLFDMNFGQSSTLDAILVHRHGERHHGMLKLFPDSKGRANERIIHLLRTTPVTLFLCKTHKTRVKNDYKLWNLFPALKSFLSRHHAAFPFMQLNSFGDTFLGNGMSTGSFHLPWVSLLYSIPGRSVVR